MIARLRTHRPALSVILTTVVALAGLQVAATAPATADPQSPTTASVTAKLDALGRRTEQLAEQFNKARLDVRRAADAAAAAGRATAAARTGYRSAQVTFARLMQDDYQNASLGSAGALLASNSSGDYLERLATEDLVERRGTEVLEQLRTARHDAEAARARAAKAVARATAARKDVVARQKAVADRTDELEQLLATLTARQQRQYAQRDAATPAQTVKVRAVHAGSAAAQRAVDFALAQLGKPYAFGGEGPGSYDCSGLTKMAWQAGGVSLPHLAADQYNYGTHVGVNDLQPGDLLFFYSPIGHVSMYVGHGMLVSAPQTGENVKLVPLAHALPDFVGATRLA